MASTDTSTTPAFPSLMKILAVICYQERHRPEFASIWNPFFSPSPGSRSPTPSEPDLQSNATFSSCPSPTIPAPPPSSRVPSPAHPHSARTPPPTQSPSPLLSPKPEPEPEPDADADSGSEPATPAPLRPKQSRVKGRSNLTLAQRLLYYNHPQSACVLVDDHHVECTGCHEVLTLDGRRTALYRDAWQKHRDSCAGIDLLSRIVMLYRDRNQCGKLAKRRVWRLSKLEALYAKRGYDLQALRQTAPLASW